MKTPFTRSQMLNYLICFLIRWDKAVQNDEGLSSLKTEFKNFCDYNYLPHVSADELIEIVKGLHD